MWAKPLVGFHAIQISLHDKYHFVQVIELVKVGYSDDSGNQVYFYFILNVVSKFYLVGSLNPEKFQSKT